MLWSVTDEMPKARTPPTASPNTDSPSQLWSSPAGPQLRRKSSSQTTLSTMTMSTCADRGDGSVPSAGFHADCDDLDMRCEELDFSMAALSIGDDTLQTKTSPNHASQPHHDVLRGVGAIHAQATYIGKGDNDPLSLLEPTPEKSREEKIAELGVLAPRRSLTNFRVEVNYIQEYYGNTYVHDDPDWTHPGPSQSSSDNYATPDWDLDFRIDHFESFDFGAIDPAMRDTDGQGDSLEPPDFIDDTLRVNEPVFQTQDEQRRDNGQAEGRGIDQAHSDPLRALAALDSGDRDEQDPTQCPQCGRHFQDHKKCQIHQRDKHGLDWQTFRCACGFVDARKHDYQRHLRECRCKCDEGHCRFHKKMSPGESTIYTCKCGHEEHDKRAHKVHLKGCTHGHKKAGRPRKRRVYGKQ